MRLYLILFLLAGLLACSADDHTTDGLLYAMKRARTACEATNEEMLWLETLLEQAGTEGSAYGNVYMIPTSQGTVFVHQPVMMSCLACRSFSCSGGDVPLADPIIQNEVIPGIRKANLLYKAPL